MRADGLSPDIITYGAACAACAAVGDADRALNLIGEMQNQKGGGIRPNLIILTSAMNALGRQGRWQESLRLLDVMRDEGLTPDRLVECN